MFFQNTLFIGIYTSVVICNSINLTKSYGIAPSMSRRGNPYDNAMAENIFSILKTECIYRYKPATFLEASEMVDHYNSFLQLRAYPKQNRDGAAYAAPSLLKLNVPVPVAFCTACTNWGGSQSWGAFSASGTFAFHKGQCRQAQNTGGQQAQPKHQVAFCHRSGERRLCRRCCRCQCLCLCRGPGPQSP